MSTSFARSLRQQATPAEARFWVLLYTARLLPLAGGGWEGYSTEFNCSAAKPRYPASVPTPPPFLKIAQHCAMS